MALRYSLSLSSESMWTSLSDEESLRRKPSSMNLPTLESPKGTPDWSESDPEPPVSLSSAALGSLGGGDGRSTKVSARSISTTDASSLCERTRSCAFALARLRRAFLSSKLAREFSFRIV